MQVHPIKSTLHAPGTKRLKLKYDDLISSFAFNLNLRRYHESGEAASVQLHEDFSVHNFMLDVVAGRCRLKPADTRVETS